VLIADEVTIDLLIVDEFVSWLLRRDVQINGWRRESLPSTRGHGLGRSW